MVWMLASGAAAVWGGEWGGEWGEMMVGREVQGWQAGHRDGLGRRQ